MSKINLTEYVGKKVKATRRDGKIIRGTVIHSGDERYPFCLGSSAYTNEGRFWADGSLAEFDIIRIKAVGVQKAEKGRHASVTEASDEGRAIETATIARLRELIAAATALDRTIGGRAIHAISQQSVDGAKAVVQAKALVQEAVAGALLALPSLSARLDAQAAEIERLRATEKLWFEARGVITERDKAQARVAELEGRLRNVIAEWRDRSANMPNGGYHEASAANSAAADTLDGCADEIDAAIAKREAVLPDPCWYSGGPWVEESKGGES